MAANTDPIYGRAPDSQLFGAVLGPSAQGGTVPSQGVDANTVSIYQADAVEGSFVRYVKLKPVGSPAATVVRVYICSVTGTYTAGTSNTLATVSMIAEISTASWTASASSASPDLIIPINEPLPPGYRLLIGFGTSTGAAGTGYQGYTSALKY